MRVLLLCAGYGTRLERDLQSASEKSDQYRHLVGIPKPLLPIGGQPLISHWVKEMKNVKEIKEIIILVNDLNKHHFENWLKSETSAAPIVLLSEGTTSNEGRRGAVACINFVVEKFFLMDTKEDLIVTAGDTLFYKDFSLQNLIEEFGQYKQTDATSSVVVGCPCPESDVHKRGILELDVNNRVVACLEKPQPTETASRLQCPCFYILSNSALGMLDLFLEERKNEPLEAKDAPGHFIRFIINRLPVYCSGVSGRFDVGGLMSYLQCCHYFTQEGQS